MSTREIYKEATSRVLKVYEIFQDYFGEDKVDLQGLRTEEAFVSLLGDNVSSDDNLRQYIKASSHLYIYVHFPEVRVTNEHDRYVDIKHLWARVEVLPDGRLANKFTLNRSEYSLDHLASDYMHSHISGINWDSPATFMVPCTGSGPINRTITSLCTEYDEALWLLFCCELGLYVTVESLNGVPYRKLEQIGTGQSPRPVDNNIPRLQKNNLQVVHYRIVSDFYRYFIRKRCLKFSYCGGGYYLGMSFLEFRILLSNYFIEWINRPDNPYRLQYSYSRLLRDEVLKKYIIKNNILYAPVTRRFGGYRNEEELRAHFENKRMFMFKGEEIRTSISSDDNQQSSENFTLLLDKSICEKILSLILRAINYNYGTNNNGEADSDPLRETRYI